jgi:hypothetical protein
MYACMHAFSSLYARASIVVAVILLLLLLLLL